MIARRHAQPRVDILEGRTLLSTLITETEPNNSAVTADVIRLDSADGSADVMGRLRGGDRDFFRFQSDVNGKLALSSQATGRTAIVDVFNATTRQHVWTGLTGTAGGSTVLDVTAGSSWLIRLRGASPRGLAQYGLHLAVSANPPFSVAPVVTTPGGNNGGGGTIQPTTPKTEPSDASTIAFDANGRTSVAGSLNAGETDVYSFTAPRSGRVTIAPVGRVPIRIDALDANGNPLLTMYGDTSNFISYFNVTQGAVYSVRVSRGPNAPAGPVSYQLNLAIS